MRISQNDLQNTRKNRTMWRATMFAALLAACAHVATDAQEVGLNVNVVSGVANEFIGDMFLQRQNEPMLGISAINPEHMMVVYNDYRTIDIENDAGAGTGTPASMVTRLFRLFRPPAQRAKPAEAANAEGWIGYSLSDNGGKTWYTGLFPGYPNDPSPEGQVSPLMALGPNAAASDPVLATTHRFFILGGISFVRGGDSIGWVARFEDKNDSERERNIEYDSATGTQVLVRGNSGIFTDKPAVAASPGGKVYAAFVLFDGQDKTGKFQSRIMLFRSTDHGRTWSKNGVKVSNPGTRNQAPWIVIDPNNDNIVYVGWRVFSENRIVGKKSFNGGQSFVPTAPYAVIPSFNAADQLQVSSLLPGGPQFRTNAYPTGAIDGNGVLHVAVAERTNAAGVPTPPGAPGRSRIVVTSSYDGGITWTARRAIDNGPGSGPQVMPVMTSAGVPGPRCGVGPVAGPASLVSVMYYQAALPAAHEGPIAGGGTPIHVRLAQANPCNVDPSTRLPVFAPAVQVSRYTRSAIDVPETGTQVGQIVRAPSAGLNVVDQTHYTAENRAYTAFGGGTISFIGDYNHIIPKVPAVLVNGVWKPTTATGIPASQLPAAAFRGVWADMRDVVLPRVGPSGLTPTASAHTVDQLPWYHYQHPSSGNPPSTCNNAGSRDQNIYTAEITSRLVASAPITFKPTNIPRAFPVYVENHTGDLRYAQLTISPAVVQTSFDILDGRPNIHTSRIVVGPYSTVTGTVYVAANFTTAVRVAVEETNADGDPLAGGVQTTLTLNTIGGTDAAAANTETRQPVVELLGSNTLSPFAQNPFAQNPFAQNPFAQNPFAQNTAPQEITDVHFRVTNGGNVASSFNAIATVQNALALQGSYAFQVIINRIYKVPGLENCQTVDVSTGQQISNITNPFAQNPFAQNPFAQNPFAQNPFAQNPFAQNAAPPEASNSTFYVAPAEGDGSARRVEPAKTPGLWARLASRATSVLGIAPRFLAARSTSAPMHGVAGTSFRSAESSASAVEMQGPDPSQSFAPRHPDEVIYTIRVFRMVANPPVTFNPTNINLTVVAQAPDIDATGTFDPDGPNYSSSGPLVVFTGALQDATANDEYGPSQLVATGGAPPYTWDLVTAGTLPAGMSLSTAGVLSGTPTEAGTYVLNVRVTDSEETTATRYLTLNVVEPEPNPNVGFFSNTDIASAGVGGMRGNGTGSITLAGVSGSVTRAFLYWHGPSNQEAPANQAVTVNGIPVTGTAVGTADDNNWEGFVYSHAYRADVTSLVRGNGTYALSNFRKLDAETNLNEDVNGASLVVLFTDFNDANNRNVYLFDGNDSNAVTGQAAAENWNTALPGITYNGGAASIQLHIADGQDFPSEADDGAVTVTNPTAETSVTIAPAGDNYQGDSVPPSAVNGLWDIESYALPGLVVGSNDLVLTSPGVSDALSLIVTVVSVPTDPPVIVDVIGARRLEAEGPSLTSASERGAAAAGVVEDRILR